jgi:hypothetical protein
MSQPINRRSFLKAGTTAAVGTYVARSLPAAAATEGATEPGAVAIHTPLNTFPYGDVQLLDGPMKRQFD